MYCLEPNDSDQSLMDASKALGDVGDESREDSTNKSSYSEYRCIKLRSTSVVIAKDYTSCWTLIALY